MKTLRTNLLSEKEPRKIKREFHLKNSTMKKKHIVDTLKNQIFEQTRANQ